MVISRVYFPRLLLFIQIISGVMSSFVILWLYITGNVKLPSLSLAVSHDQHMSDDHNMDAAEPRLFQ